MDNFEHNIDDVFRERFEGLNDHSVDPASQWSAVETALGAGEAVVGTSVAPTSSSVWPMAASFVTILTIGGLVSMDAPLHVDQERVIGVSAQAAIDSPSIPTESAVSWAEATQLFDGGQDQGDSQDAVLAETSYRSDDAHNVELSASDDISMIEESVVAFDESTSARDELTRALEHAARRSGLNRMAALSFLSFTQGVLERSITSEPAYVVSDDRSEGLFVRGGVRFGSGESNSEYVAAKWRVNNVLSLGYQMDIAPKTFITFEAGHLRRSGNGIERKRGVDFSPVLNVLTPSYSPEDIATAETVLEDVDESLVATTMDYIHMPIMMHVEMNDQTHAAVGFFADYLLRVKNESYMVYNSSDYVSAEVNLFDDNSREGLKPIRFGLTAGFQRQLAPKVYADVRGMIPITSQYDRKSDFRLESEPTFLEEPSQLVDFQISLVYKI